MESITERIDILFLPSARVAHPQVKCPGETSEISIKSVGMLFSLPSLAS